MPFSGERIPGDVLEGALAHIRGGRRLGKYDFVDVVHDNARVGWQVKSTAEATPVTWKRAKISGRDGLIRKSENSDDGARELGKAIIDFCNAAIIRAFDEYNIDVIGYARLIVHPDATATYFERKLVTRESPTLFKHDDFRWNWTRQREGGKKEQLSAFHGYHAATNTKWWAWHGRGENQLHFSGERTWWPPCSDTNAIRFRLPDTRYTLDELIGLLDP